MRRGEMTTNVKDKQKQKTIMLIKTHPLGEVMSSELRGR